MLSNASHGKFQTPPLTPPVPTLPGQPSGIVPVEVPVKVVQKKEETSFTKPNGNETSEAHSKANLNRYRNCSVLLELITSI